MCISKQEYNLSNFLLFYVNCLYFITKLQAHPEPRKTIHGQETKQSAKPDSDMTKLLELSDREFKTSLAKSKPVVEMVDNMHCLWYIIKKNIIEILEMKYTANLIKNVSSGPISR